LIIFNEANGEVNSDSVTVNWLTTAPATSRVVYDTISHQDLGPLPNYGYAYSTSQDSNKVTSHSVTITSLTPGTTYYWRAISSGSPEVFGRELSFTTAHGEEGGSGSVPTPTPSFAEATEGEPESTPEPTPEPTPTPETSPTPTITPTPTVQPTPTPTPTSTSQPTGGQTGQQLGGEATPTPSSAEATEGEPTPSGEGEGLFEITPTPQPTEEGQRSGLELLLGGLGNLLSGIPWYIWLLLIIIIIILFLLSRRRRKRNNK